MKAVAVVLTRNQYATARRDLFEQTIVSLGEVDELYVVDNHSDDGTAQLIKDGHERGEWVAHLSQSENTTSGYGTSLAMRVARGSAADLCIVSDDDMEWKLGFRSALEDWWAHAPADLVLTGGHLEPEFEWNRIHDTVHLGDVDGLLRASTGAASWTFRSDRWELLSAALRSVPNKVQGVWDVPFCQHLARAGRTIGQIDVAEHVGQGRSSWGNGTEHLYGWDVDPVRSRLIEGVRAP